MSTVFDICRSIVRLPGGATGYTFLAWVILGQINLRKENPVVQRSPKTEGHQGEAFAHEAAIAALGFLAADPERLQRFLGLSGLGPHNLRRAAADPAFLGAVLDYLAGDEPLLIAFASHQSWRPEDVIRARDALGGPSSGEVGDADARPAYSSRSSRPKTNHRR